MTRSAPDAAARVPLAALLTVVITNALLHAASWIAALPTAPAPPVTRTVRPDNAPGDSSAGPSSEAVRQGWAVMKGTPSLAPGQRKRCLVTAQRIQPQ